MGDIYPFDNILIIYNEKFSCNWIPSFGPYFRYGANWWQAYCQLCELHIQEFKPKSTSKQFFVSINFYISHLVTTDSTIHALEDIAIFTLTSAEKHSPNALEELE
jgi:hypothetical protein